MNIPGAFEESHNF